MKAPAVYKDGVSLFQVNMLSVDPVIHVPVERNQRFEILMPVASRRIIRENFQVGISCTDRKIRGVVFEQFGSVFTDVQLFHVLISVKIRLL